MQREHVKNKLKKLYATEQYKERKRNEGKRRKFKKV